MSKLQVQTEEQVKHLKEILTSSAGMACDVHNSSIQMYDWFEFDQLADAVDYLREPYLYQLEAIYSGFGLHGEKTSKTVTRNFDNLDDAEDYISDNQILKVWKSRFDFDPQGICLEYPLVQYKITAVYKVDVKKVTL